MGSPPLGQLEAGGIQRQVPHSEHIPLRRAVRRSWALTRAAISTGLKGLAM